jgi:hypothetical protein
MEIPPSKSMIEEKENARSQTVLVPHSDFLVTGVFSAACRSVNS